MDKLTAGSSVALEGRKYEFLYELIPGVATIKSQDGETREVRTDKLMRIKS